MTQNGETISLASNKAKPKANSELRTAEGDRTQNPEMINSIIQIARSAGEIILEEYTKNAEVADWKADDSPLTLADQKSHNYIVGELSKHFPEIPILSEEGKEIPWETRKTWSQFWCVDPMDGTKEFIKKTGQFTVNIALIKDGKAILGVIFVPVMNLLYFADENGAYTQLESEPARAIQIRQPDLNQPDIVASKDHAGPQVKALIEAIPGASLKSMGSSLKFCLIAEGKADCYLRDVPTYEWDTAAAQAIVEAAGGSIVTLDGQALKYNKENILNPSLLTVGARVEHWRELISSKF